MSCLSLRNISHKKEPKTEDFHVWFSVHFSIRQFVGIKTNTDPALVGDDIERVAVPREDVENGNDEEEEPQEAVVPRARMKSQEPHLSRETRTLRRSWSRGTKSN